MAKKGIVTEKSISMAINGVFAGIIYTLALLATTNILISSISALFVVGYGSHITFKKNAPTIISIVILFAVQAIYSGVLIFTKIPLSNDLGSLVIGVFGWQIAGFVSGRLTELY